MSQFRLLVTHSHSYAAPPYVAPAIVYPTSVSSYDYSSSCIGWMGFYANGVCQKEEAYWGRVTAFTWLISGAASDYDVRFTKTSGSSLNYGLPSAMTDNQWYNLGANPQAGGLLVTGTGNANTWNGTVAIKYNANSTIISSNSCTIYAEVV